jgi:hypothetical protein
MWRWLPLGFFTLACAGLGGKAAPKPEEVEGLWYLVDTEGGQARSRDWCEAQRQTLSVKGSVATMSLGQEDVEVHARTVGVEGEGLVLAGDDGRLTLTWASPQRRLHLQTGDGFTAVAVRPERPDGVEILEVCCSTPAPGELPEEVGLVHKGERCPEGRKWGAR